MVGRIAGIINEMETEHLGEKHARFGWIEFVDDLTVSGALLGAVENWAKQRQAILLKGPYGFNQLDKNGTLIYGFDTLGTANTIFNFEYYPRHFEQHGYEKDLEWVEVDLKMPDHVPEKFVKFTDLARQRYGMQVFQPRTKDDVSRFGKQMFDLMMETYRELPGFVPISKKQRIAYTERYLRLLKLDYVAITLDEAGEAIGFGVAMPSLSKALQKASGKLFPFGFLHLKAALRKNDTANLSLIGVKEEWRKRGAHGVVFANIGQAFVREGVSRVQINPMLEFNIHVLGLWKEFEHEIYKRRRTFKKAL